MLSRDTAASTGGNRLVGWFTERMRDICGRDFPVDMGARKKTVKEEGNHWRCGWERAIPSEGINSPGLEDKREKASPACWTHCGEEKKVGEREFGSDSDQTGQGRVTRPPRNKLCDLGETRKKGQGANFSMSRGKGPICKMDVRNYRKWNRERKGRLIWQRFSSNAINFKE